MPTDEGNSPKESHESMEFSCVVAVAALAGRRRRRGYLLLLLEEGLRRSRR
jgi:hypothetical protein